MLKSIFDWLDLHPGSFWVLALAASGLLVARFVVLLGQERRGPATPPRGAAWPDALVLFLFLIAWRWPFLFIAHELNPDESQLTAGAMALARDPVFWRAVDGGSSGPLNYYFPLPWHWIGAPLDYFTVRLTGLLLIWGALFTCLRTLARTYGRIVAWLAVLPAAAFFATVSHPELVHYSTEHLPLLLMALAFSFLAGRPPADRTRLQAACLAAGALPWTKLQTAPIALALLGWAGWQLLRAREVAVPVRWRQAAEAVVAAALPSLLLAGMAAVTGQTEAAVRRYFLQNMVYVGNGTPLVETLRALWRNAQIDGRFPLFLGIVGAGLLATTAYFIWRRLRPSGLQVAAGIVTLVALAAVVAPRREFLHYILLLPVPLTLCLGAALGGWWAHWPGVRSRLLLAGVFFVVGLLSVITRCFTPVPPIYGQFAYDWRHPRASTAAILHVLAGRNDTLGIWGWACNLYVESGLPQATRDGTTYSSINPGPQQAYHRAVYLADLKKSAPAVFVDAVGQGAFMFDYRAVQAHEIFPELTDYLRANYVLVVDLLEVRIYARRGLATLAELPPARLWQLVGQGRQPEQFAYSPPSSALDRLQRKIVGGRHVVMLLPPAEVEWQLDDDVREVSLEFGYDPVAYEQGKSNGTDLFLEIAEASGPRTIFHRFLDPARVPGDRGPQTARVTLPPRAPGATLVLRSDPGQFGDNAWDWVYLASLKLHRASDVAPK